MTEDERAVIEAAKAWWKAYSGEGDTREERIARENAFENLFDAVDALEAKL